MHQGLALGHHFGVIGSTDHHSAHPGSYDHGRTGIWARELTRDGIWDALLSRRTVALTGDRIALQFCVNGRPMGARIEPSRERTIAFEVRGGGPIDSVDVLKNGSLLRRFSPYESASEPAQGTVRTKLVLELGWGERGLRTDWQVTFGISAGRILGVEPRFRGLEVVAPTEVTAWTPDSHHLSHWTRPHDREVHFQTVTFGNPTNRTPATQAFCLEVEMPASAAVVADINGMRLEMPLARLREGARSGRLGPIGSACYRLHRAPEWWEVEWGGSVIDQANASPSDWYAVRVRQANDQMAWSSPIRLMG
jgi:hypothetical protein